MQQAVDPAVPPGSWIQIGSAPAVTANWGVNQLMEDHLTVSVYKSPFPIKKKILKQKQTLFTWKNNRGLPPADSLPKCLQSQGGEGVGREGRQSTRAQKCKFSAPRRSDSYTTPTPAGWAARQPHLEHADKLRTSQATKVFPDFMLNHLFISSTKSSQELICPNHYFHMEEKQAER